MLIARHSNHNDVVIGTPIANRLSKELESVVGFFVNTLVLRVDCDPKERFTAYLERVREVHLDAQKYQEAPFELLVEELNPVRGASHSPLFQLVFAMDTTDQSVESTSALTFSSFSSERRQANFDLAVFAIENESGVSFRFEYNTQLFKHSTIRRLSAHLNKLCDGIAANPRMTLGQYPIVSDEEERYIVSRYNRTEKDFGQSVQQRSCLHELFITQL